MVQLHALLTQLVQGLMRAVAFAKAVRAIREVLLVDRSQQHDHRSLDDFVLERWNANRALTAVLLVEIGAPDGRCTIPPAAQPLVHVGKVGLEVLRILLRGHPVDPRRPVLPGPAIRLPQQVYVDQVRQRRERHRWILVRLLCKLLELCGDGW